MNKIYRGIFGCAFVIGRASSSLAPRRLFKCKYRSDAWSIREKVSARETIKISLAERTVAMLTYVRTYVRAYAQGRKINDVTGAMTCP